MARLSQKIIAYIHEFVASPPSNERQNFAYLTLADVIHASIEGGNFLSKESPITPPYQMADKSASLWYGDNKQIHYRDVAYINAINAHALDVDDTGYFDFSHPSAVIAPLIIAIAEANKISFDKMLYAYILAMDVSLGLGKMVGHRPYHNGFWPTGIFPLIGGAAGAGYLLNYNDAYLDKAFNLISAKLLPSRLHNGSDYKPILLGECVNHIFWALDEATTPHQANLNALDNIIPLYGGGEISQDIFVASAFSPSALIFKRFPLCSSLQALCEAAIELHPQINDIRNITHIYIDTTSMVKASLPYHKICTQRQAMFSYSYAPLIALKGGDFTTDNILSAPSYDDDIKKLMDNITLLVREDIFPLDKFPEGAKMTCVMQDGQRLISSCNYAMGDPRIPFHKDDFLKKWRYFSHYKTNSDIINTVLQRAV